MRDNIERPAWNPLPFCRYNAVRPAPVARPQDLSIIQGKRVNLTTGQPSTHNFFHFFHAAAVILAVWRD
jgi:hypothetical protein